MVPAGGLEGFPEARVATRVPEIVAVRIDTPAIALMLYAVFPVLYLCLLAFLLGMWAGDRLVFKGIRRQAIGHVIWKDDVVIVQPIPKDIDRSKPWSSRIWQDPS